MFTYTVSDDKVVEIFVEGQEAPMIRQPHYPNGDSFDTVEEAETWAQLSVAALSDVDAPYAPAGKGLTPMPKPSKAEILANLKKRAESYGDRAPQPLLDDIAALEAELAQ